MSAAIADRSAAKAALLARYRDERFPVPGTVAMRCTDHGTFILWVNPPAPSCRVTCPDSCAVTS